MRSTRLRAPLGRRTGALGLALLLLGPLAPALSHAASPAPAEDAAAGAATIPDRFRQQVRPLLTRYCVRCHNADRRESGIRLDDLDGQLEGRRVALWRGIQRQLAEGAMPPEGELQPSAAQRQLLDRWIGEAIDWARTRPRAKNGQARRLTVAQYQNTLRDLLGIDERLTETLPPDAVSRDGFLNHAQTMLVSPLLVEAYLDVAERALALCLVDESARPVVQNFQVELGAGLNPTPCPDALILGANSHLLRNEDFVVKELEPARPFPYEPFRMRTRYRFIEGYEGNATVRGWREYDSIYHAVFACMRGTEGYPRGLAYQTVPEGLLLRPAIPSAELFQVESTYGPRANFKISLRELPEHGRFRVTVRAARYDDGLLLEPGASPRSEPARGTVTIANPSEPQRVHVPASGIYQLDVRLAGGESLRPDASRLEDGLLGHWPLDGDARARLHPAGRDQPSGAATLTEALSGELVGNASYQASPFGQAVQLAGDTGAVVVPATPQLDVGEGEFTVAAWIHPRQLRQAGIVVRGGYGYTHGWVFDMPDDRGVLRLETATNAGQHNGTVQSPPGVIRVDQWQHVAVAVKRGQNNARLFVNGFQVAAGTIGGAPLDNARLGLHIGRVPAANLFRGEIDEVRLYRRALAAEEIQALVAPGSQLVQPPAPDPGKPLMLTLGARHFSGPLQSAFLALRLPAGETHVSASYGGPTPIASLVLTPLAEDDPLARQFSRFERRKPRLGVHLGLRRDCGSTLAQVGEPLEVNSTDLQSYVFEGAIKNYPSPEVEKDNVNYLAGLREIGVRSEYTDGRDMPRLLIRSVEFEGPLYDSWPPETHRRILPGAGGRAPAAYARQILRDFATRAYRREVTDAEEALLMAVWQRSQARGGDFQHGIRDALLVVLTSPQFLFLVEDSQGPQAEPLDDYELASKLSYFLWNTAPDEPLLRLAAQGQLRSQLDTQIKRLIGDPRFSQFADAFTSQWLSLDKLDVVEVDRQRFPKLTRDAKLQLRREPIEFMRHLIQHNLPLRNLIASDFIVANEVVADYYGLGDLAEQGFEFVPILHRDSNGDSNRESHLGGLLAQAGILAGLSDGREANPIKRGAWLARKIIAEPPNDPPPNVPRLDEDTSHLPLKERLARHRDQPGCAKCHAGIDPWGLPLQQFDAGGHFRTDLGDASSTLPDQTSLADFEALRTYLADEHLEKVAFSFLKHLALYACGRDLAYNELELLKRKAVELRPTGYRLQDLVRLVIHSEIFLEK